MGKHIAAIRREGQLIDAATILAAGAMNELLEPLSGFNIPQVHNIFRIEVPGAAYISAIRRGAQCGYSTFETGENL